jgi:hypothetical protein
MRTFFMRRLDWILFGALLILGIWWLSKYIGSPIDFGEFRDIQPLLTSKQISDDYVEAMHDAHNREFFGRRSAAIRDLHYRATITAAQLQRRLASRGQLDIDRCQQLGVEQSAVLRAARTINAIARA